jgi:hypothetical protein
MWMFMTFDTKASNDLADEQNVGCTEPLFLRNFHWPTADLMLCPSLSLNTKVIFPFDSGHGSFSVVSISLTSVLVELKCSIF